MLDFIPRIELNTVTYNAARSAFQARVDIHRAGRTFRYPCEVKGPMDMGEDEVHSRLCDAALAMSDSPRLHSAR